MTAEEAADLRKQKYNATVVRVRKVHNDLVVMRVRPDFPRPPHKAGQYCVLGLGYWEPRVDGCQEELLEPGDEIKLARRSYSLSCPILDDDGLLLDRDATDWIEFYITLVRQKEGQAPALTPRLFTLGEGDRLFMGTKITGHFTLDFVGPTDTVLFLSTGTGEAPHNYMLWELLRREHPARVVSVCCVRRREDLAYLATHEELVRRYPNYTYVQLTTRDLTGGQGKKYIQDLIRDGDLERILGQQLDPSGTHVYLCGNPAMIGVPGKDRETGQKVYPQPPGVVELLEQRGFAIDQPQKKFAGNIHFEEYW